MKKVPANATVWMASPAAAAGGGQRVTTVNEEILRRIEWVYSLLFLWFFLQSGLAAGLGRGSWTAATAIGAFALAHFGLLRFARKRSVERSPVLLHTLLGTLLCPVFYLWLEADPRPWWPGYAMMAGGGAVMWTLQGSAAWGRLVLLLYLGNLLLTAAVGLRPVPWAALLAQVGMIGAMGALLVELTRILSQSLSKVYERSLQHRKGKEEFQELARLKTDFFANVSHEFRTPIALTLTPIEAVLRGRHGDVSPEARQQLEHAARSQRRLLGLINQILDAAKIEAKAVELKATRVADINLWLQERVEPFRAMAESRRVALRIRLDPLAKGTEIYLDTEKFEKILLNLLSNAFKFTERGFVEVSSEVHGDRFLLRVGDSGKGIPEAELPHVFERFRQSGKRGSGEIAGTGIGLTLVKEFTQLHGGEVRAQSRPGEGTTFEVAIPLGRAHLNEAQIAEGTGEAPMGTAAETYSSEGASSVSCMELNSEAALRLDPDMATIVCAEDNPDLRYLLRDLLSDGYNVFVGAHGEEALRLAERRRPDLILSDVSMPVMDGLEFCRKVRENRELNGIPFVLLTAQTLEETKLAGLDRGADDYLLKPFSEAELLARVKNLISLRKKQLRLQRELAAARAIQMALLPAAPQRFDGLSLDFLYSPSEELSGDFCDILPQGEWVYFYVADVTSHGTASAQVTYLLKEIFAELLARSGQNVELPELLMEARRRYAVHRLNYDVAIQVARYHLGRKVLQVARSGMPSPLWVRPNEETKPISVRASPSLSHDEGALEGSSVHVSEVQLRAGDLVYFFTDGCYEFEAASGGFGLKQFHQALFRTSPDPEWKESLLGQLSQVHGSGSFPDDLTCLRLSPC